MCLWFRYKEIKKQGGEEGRRKDSKQKQNNIDEEERKDEFWDFSGNISSTKPKSFTG